MSRRARATSKQYTSDEWAQKFHSLQRNYDALTRICKEKCIKTEELQRELENATQQTQKLSELSVKNEESLEQNQKLQNENRSLNGMVESLEKKLNATESELEKNKRSLQRKSQTSTELEEIITSLRGSLCALDEKQTEHQQRLEEYEKHDQEKNAKLTNLQNDNNSLSGRLTTITAENKALTIKLIQKDNVIVAKVTKLDHLSANFKDTDREYQRLIAQFAAMETKCSGYQADIDSLSDRLRHYDNDQSTSDKVQRLKEMIEALEAQNKFHRITIDELTKVKEEYVQFQGKYDTLKQCSDDYCSKLEKMQHKYTDLHDNYQTKIRQLNEMTEQNQESTATIKQLKETMSENEIELTLIRNKYRALTDSHSALQRQYASVVNQTNEKNANGKSQMQLLSEQQQSLRNEFQRLLLENEEWLTKYEHLKKTFDALNEDYINCKNHSLQIESLQTETQSAHQQNLQQMQKLHDDQARILKREIRDLNTKIEEMMNENILLRNKPTLSMSEYHMLCNKEEQLLDIVNKMFVADHAMEPSFKCGYCNQLYNEPATCQPCGHSYCATCISQKKNICKECKVKVKAFANDVLDNMTNKFKMRTLTYLPALQQLAKRKTNVTGVII